MSGEFFECPGPPPVRGFLHLPRAERRAGAVVLAHGAGTDANSPLLWATAEAMADAGIAVLRIDLPFRQERPKGPPSPAGASRNREGLRQAALALRDITGGAVFLGGHSYGGRQASMLCAGDRSAADGLLLLSYPLHPPRRKDELRTAHFTELQTPALFIHGTRDPFGSIEELSAALRLIPGRTKVLAIEGAGHELKAKGKDTGAAAIITRAFLDFP